MSANINSMMYVGEKPWHKLGVELKSAATSEQAIEAAGLGWEVEKRPVLFSAPDNTIQTMPDRFVTVRTDTQAPLGVVGTDYTVVQNKEAFSFFDAVVGEKLAMYHTAGALGAGERVWIMAKLPGHIRVIGDDVVEKFLLLSNGHDGGHSVRMLFTPVRVVCQNTLNVALNGGEKLGAKLRHTSGIGMKIEEVREQLGIVSGLYNTFEELSKKLVTVQMRPVMLEQYLTDSLGLKIKKGEKELGTLAKKMLEEVTGLFEKGRGNDMAGVKGTAWAAFNAVAEFSDYRRARGGEEATRTKSLLWGNGANMKQRAFDNALVLAK